MKTLLSLPCGAVYSTCKVKECRHVSQLLFLTHNNNKYQSIKDIQSNYLYSATMTYDTINDEEVTPLKIQGGYSDDATGVAPSTKKRASSSIVRAMMVGTAVAVGVLLVMAGPSKMTTMNKSSNVDGMVVVSSEPEPLSHCYSTTCHVPPYGEAFSGLSCKDSDGFCAGPGESFRKHPAMNHYETCYISRNGYCWSRAHQGCFCHGTQGCHGYFDRCDPVGYFDGDDGYEREGFWHVSAPRYDGFCGNPCREFITLQYDNY